MDSLLPGRRDKQTTENTTILAPPWTDCSMRPPRQPDLPTSIAAAYDPGLLAVAGERLATRLAEAVQTRQAGEGHVLPQATPAEQLQKAESFLAAEAHNGPLAERFDELIRVALAHGIALHHPRYVGHQVPPPVPLAGLFDAVGATMNQGMAIFEMGPWAMAVEQALAKKLAGLLGWSTDSCNGLATHGGSLANLTALLTARNVLFPSAWQEGLPRSGPPPVIVAHADAHYCITRAAGILGLGTQQIVPAALDDRRRIDPNQLETTLQDLRRSGTPIVAVVACSCSTPVGAFDPLVPIAEICHRHQVWLHVDAAHGGGVLTSPLHRHLLQGINQADSVVIDAHKMLFMPALCTFLFYRQRQHAYAAFQQQAPYLFATDSGSSDSCRADFDGGLRTVECTKRATAFGLWGVWSMFGEQLFADLVETVFAKAQHLYSLLTDADDFEPLYEPQANILTFRHLPARVAAAPDAIQSGFQRLLRQTVVASGEFYLVTTTIDGSTVLRTTLMNPLTSDCDLETLLETLRATGRGIDLTDCV